MTRSIRNSLVAPAILGLLSAASAAQEVDWARLTLEQAVEVQGNNQGADPKNPSWGSGRAAVESVDEVFFRIRFKSYKEGSGGKTVEAEGFMRQFFKPPHVLRIEMEDDTDKKVVTNVKLYDARIGQGMVSRHTAATRRDHPLDPEADRKTLQELRDQIRTLRYVFLNYFLQSGSTATLGKASRDERVVQWTEGDRADEVLRLRFRNLYLTRVDVVPKNGGESYVIELEGHERFGKKKLLFPTKATVSRNGEKVLELHVTPGGLVLDPSVPAKIYESASEDSPAAVE